MLLSMHVIDCFIKWWKPRFLISERIFHPLLLNYKIKSLCMKLTSHIRPSDYD